MNGGILKVSLKLLEDALHLPKGVRITSIGFDRWEIHNSDVFEVRLEGPTLPEVKEGEKYPYLMAFIHEKDGEVEVTFE